MAQIQISILISILFRYPFDWKNPVGYTFMILFQISYFFVSCSAFSFPLILFVGICMFATSFADDLKACLRIWKYTQNLNKKQPKSKKAKEMFENLKLIINFHGEAIQLSKIDFNVCALY